GLPGGGEGRAAVGLHGAIAGAAPPRLGPLLPPRLQAGGARVGALQLVPVPGELDRPRPLRMAAHELVAGASWAGGAVGAGPHPARLRRVRLRLRLPAGA